MFNKLTDFAYHRTTKEAIGFFLAYFLLVIIVESLIVGLFGSLIPEEVYENGLNIHKLISISSAVVLSYLIMKQRNQTKNSRYIVLTVLSGIVGIVGPFLALLIPAYLTTQKDKEKHRVSPLRQRLRRGEAKVSKAKKV